MNGREGGCCIEKYDVMYGMSKVDRIMLKFRPIAPKPVPIGPVSGNSTTDNGDGYVNCERSKRKYVRVKKKKKKINDCSRRREKIKVKISSSISPPPVITLPLLQEINSDRKLNEPVTGFSDLLSPVQSTAVMERRLPQVVSYVTVECVTDTWIETGVLGCTDEEIMMNMEKDTCPGFISDGEDRVVWTNKAYRHMVGEDDISVVLVWKDRSRVIYPGFTCKVRVTFSGPTTLTLPCDVWRMDFGNCVWRLDVKAALSLGR